MSCFEFSANTDNGRFKAKCTTNAVFRATKEEMIFSASYVCSLNSTPYLRINPTVLWLTNNMSGRTDVSSNTFWRIN